MSQRGAWWIDSQAPEEVGRTASRDEVIVRQSTTGYRYNLPTTDGTTAVYLTPDDRRTLWRALSSQAPHLAELLRDDLATGLREQFGADLVLPRDQFLQWMKTEETTE